MGAEEIADRIALLINPMPDMSGRQINRFHGTRRRHIEELAAAISDDGRAKKAAEVLDDICRPSALRLMAGEMTDREMRTAQAVAKGIRAKVLAALDHPEQSAGGE